MRPSSGTPCVQIQPGSGLDSGETVARSGDGLLVARFSSHKGVEIERGGLLFEFPF